MPGKRFFPRIDSDIEPTSRLFSGERLRLLTSLDMFFPVGWIFHFEMANRLYLPLHSNHPPAFFELLRYSKWVRVDDLAGALKEGPHKMVVTLNHSEDRPRLIREMTATLGPEVTIVPSHPFLVEALPAGVDKGHALTWLANHLNIAQAEVMAIGDSNADIPMLKWAGVGVAMQNGSPEAKAAANWIAPPLAEDGAAVAIEKFVLHIDSPNQRQ